jgi:transposase-like protein
MPESHAERTFRRLKEGLASQVHCRDCKRGNVTLYRVDDAGQTRYECKPCRNARTYELEMPT